MMVGRAWVLLVITKRRQLHDRQPVPRPYTGRQVSAYLRDLLVRTSRAQLGRGHAGFCRDSVRRSGLVPVSAGTVAAADSTQVRVAKKSVLGWWSSGMGMAGSYTTVSELAVHRSALGSESRVNSFPSQQ
jgi:hypothetical protein